ncbi:MAG: DNA mismatch repair protein MutS [Phycisphaeraceae bacterium]|nr:DNA mismatch repair protein MutS [Phycisphaeraceae bacterium]
MADPRETPAMQQYYRFKRQHPDCVLLFRIGDFYEMFDDDAVAVSKAIGLTLTQRTEGVPMAGVPYHQLENYLRKLIGHGFRVAVCEQIQDAAEAKGIVERGVTRVLTPGTLVDESLLEADASSRLAAVAFVESGDRPRGAAAVVDLASGEFIVFDAEYEPLLDELSRRGVTEVLYAATATGQVPDRVQGVLSVLGVAGTGRPAWQFRGAEGREALLEQFAVGTLAGFGLGDDDHAIGPAGAVLRYLRDTQAPGDPGSTPRTGPLRHLRPPRREDPATGLVIDSTTLRALEVVRTLRDGDAAGSLLGVFSGPGGGCVTPMGKRLLRDWLCRPLSDGSAIAHRQRAVATMVEDRRTAGTLRESLGGVQDVTRIAARLALDRATPRDLVALAKSLGQVQSLSESLAGAPALIGFAERLEAVADQIAPLAASIAAACVDSPPHHLREGGLIRDGFDADLDESRGLQRDGAAWLATYQKTLVEAHSLSGIKVGFNKVFGYYIELTKSQARSAPPSFTRKQTLTNAERFITPELKDFEEKATRAEARAIAREQAIFARLCAESASSIPAIGAFADACAEIDVLQCFAEKAARRSWVRPEIVDEPVLSITQGRHPVLDELLGTNFVPNDVGLGIGEGDTAAGPRLALITGPNMAGKSTFIRQTALLALLAHTGSFVPAQRALVGLADRIFTRVGADDALHAGQSTFMVEMTETARILHHATERSIVILDEIGRGTSTLDGLALAWAIAETLAAPGGREPRSRRGAPRTLFATHYHELTGLEEQLQGRVMNLHVSVREWGESIVFLHRILPGRTSQSYGIHVAKLAGIPSDTVRRAREVLESLAVHHSGSEPGHIPPRRPEDVTGTRPVPNGQLSLFTEYVPHPAIDALREIKIDTLTPLQAFDALRQLKGMTDG